MPRWRVPACSTNRRCSARALQREPHMHVRQLSNGRIQMRRCVGERGVLLVREQFGQLKVRQSQFWTAANPPGHRERVFVSVACASHVARERRRAAEEPGHALEVPVTLGKVG
jgi:hypothetical protein